MSDVKTILEKLDDVADDIGEIKLTQAKQAVVLEQHIRRSTSNEEILDIVRKDADSRLRILESHKDRVMGAIALVGILCTLILGLHQLGFFK